MSNYSWLTITEPEGFAKLADLLDGEFAPASVAERLAKSISSAVKGIIHSEHRVHLLGHRLSVWGFPSMSQHVDISVCAHVACWGILRHYSERFPQHRELLLHEITMLAQQFDPGGMRPALGLNVPEAERIFQAAGTFPITVIRRKDGDDPSFYAQMLAYMESGFPLFVAMNGQHHAFVAAGHAWKIPAAAPGPTSHAWGQVDSILAIDDNMLPYTTVPVTAGGEAGEAAYTAADFDAFIVPLPEKIFYPAGAVETYSLRIYHLLLAKLFPMPSEGDLIRRYFVTTVSRLRQYARDHQSQFGDDLVNVLMRLSTAQFIWVVEYASGEQWARGHIAARVIIDATASERDPLPAWFAHGEQKAILFDRSSATPRGEIFDLHRPTDTPLGRMEQNLRSIVPRS